MERIKTRTMFFLQIQFRSQNPPCLIQEAQTDTNMCEKQKNLQSVKYYRENQRKINFTYCQFISHIFKTDFMKSMNNLGTDIIKYILSILLFYQVRCKISKSRLKIIHFSYNMINKKSQPMSALNEPFHVRRKSLVFSNTLNQKGSPIKKRIAAQYLPKYHKKLKLSNNKIIQPSQDRLSQLTTKQIDRLIEMQKIKSLLNDNKKGIKPTHINFIQSDSNRHPNVYQPNFIAKINRIALQRNIRHLRSEEFDQATLSPKQLRQRGLQLQKKNLRFVKQYKLDLQKQDIKTYEQLQQKSISSVEDKIQQFERTLEQKKMKSKMSLHPQTQRLAKFRHKKTNILSMTRWFNGMSTFYLNLDKPSHSYGSREGAVKSRASTTNTPGNYHANKINTPNYKCNGSTAFEQRADYDRNYDFQYENNEFSCGMNKRKSKTIQKFGNTRMATVG